MLTTYIVNKRPEVAVALIQELIRRKSLQKAFKGRDSKSLSTIVKFLHRYLTDYRFSRVLIIATNTLIEMYEELNHTFTSELIRNFKALQTMLNEEIELLKQLSSLRGAMMMILSSSSAAEQVKLVNNTGPINLIPSEDAKKSLIVNLT